MAAIPAVDMNGKPTGGESIVMGNIRTLSRSYVSIGGQVSNADRYFDLTGLTYTTSTTLGASGTNFYRTDFGYDFRGRLNRAKGPTGTIERSVYDSRGRVVSAWIGTDETGATHTNPAAAAPNNMKQVSQSIYDGTIAAPDISGVGDGNLTRAKQFPDAIAANARVTDNFYDWRNRLVASKAGVQTSESPDTNRPIFYREYDNLDRVTISEQYDGDNVTVTSTNGVPNRPSAGLLRAKSSTSFDVQGRVFRSQTFHVDQGTGAVSSNSLKTDVWYDKRGNVIKSAAPGGLVTKNQYDGAGRVTKTFATDAGGDTSWADAGNVTGDIVLSQTENSYDGNSNVTLVASKQRFHDESTTGALVDRTTAPKARVSYAASYYDAADRMTHIVNVGTNGGNAYTRPATPPTAGSDTLLLTKYVYNDAGWLETVTDPRGILQKTEYDHAGRRTKTIEASTGGVPTTNTNRTTEFTYDGMDHVLTLKAILPDDPPGTPRFQTTQYVYGVTSGTGGSDIDSNDLLKEVRYSDKLTGNPSTAEGDVESYAYNALDQLKTKKQRIHNTVPVPHVPQTHSYSYDVLGRQTADAVTELGTGVDNAVRRLETAYDEAGQAFKFSSFAVATGGTPVNEVKRTFNGLGQLITEQQDHGGAVTGGSPAVQYAYSFAPSGTNNHSRLVSMTYPNGRVVNHNYTGTDDTISRLTSLSDTSGPLESYAYLGLGTVVQRVHPEPGVDLTYIHAGPGGDSNDKYQGLDRFGRVVEQWWVKAGADKDRFKYGYDRNGNRLYRENVVRTDHSELYHANGVVDTFDVNGLLVTGAYDRLGQLTSFGRGTLNGAKDAIQGAASRSQTWGLDAQGNWSSLTNDTQPAQTRTHNQQNQILTVSGQTPPEYDNNGNLTKDETAKTYKYDAWNRLVQVVSGGTTLNYEYDAQGRRIEEAIVSGTTTHLYYSSEWQVLEERENSSTNAKVQYVWSEVYLDALVLRDRDATGDPALEERLYVQQDANFNVTALVALDVITGIWDVVERYVYDPYGAVTVLDASWVVRPGGSNFAWQYLHQGGRFSFDTGLYHFRHRDFSPTLGRWIERDPIEFQGGDTKPVPVRVEQPDELHGSDGGNCTVHYRRGFDWRRGRRVNLLAARRLPEGHHQEYHHRSCSGCRRWRGDWCRNSLRSGHSRSRPYMGRTGRRRGCCSKQSWRSTSRARVHSTDYYGRRASYRLRSYCGNQKCPHALCAA